MARSYGNTRVARKSDVIRRQEKKQFRSERRQNKYPPRPIINEEDPIPSKYQGEITFTKTIYSKGDFNRNVDSSFSELNSSALPIEIDQFFDNYNEIFFDIPKEGENSHSTIIQTSLDYVESYNNPLQPVVNNLNTQVEELEAEVRRLENEIQNLILGDGGESLEEQVENQAAQAEYDAYVAQIGDPSNPTLKYNDLKSKLSSVTSGMKKKKRERREKDLRQAYEKAKASGLKYANRSTSQWKADVKKSSSGDKERDINKAIDRQVSAIKARLNELNPN